MQRRRPEALLSDYEMAGTTDHERRLVFCSITFMQYRIRYTAPGLYGRATVLALLHCFKHANQSLCHTSLPKTQVRAKAPPCIISRTYGSLTVRIQQYVGVYNNIVSDDCASFGITYTYIVVPYLVLMRPASTCNLTAPAETVVGTTTGGQHHVLHISKLPICGSTCTSK